jgi:hypothetical protein
LAASKIIVRASDSSTILVSDGGEDAV